MRAFTFLAMHQQQDMQPFTLDRTNIAQTATITLLTVAAMALLALVGVNWTWEWLAPPVEPRAQPADNTGTHVTSAAALFGNLEQGKTSSLPMTTSIRLLGIVAAANNRRGYAVIRIEPREILTVQEGKEITPGIRLAEVGTNHVILEHDGVQEKMTWPEKGAAVQTAVPRINK